MSSEQAKQELIKSLEEQARSEAKHIISDIENNTRKEATEKATHIISLATHRLAGDFVNDATVTVVNLPSENERKNNWSRRSKHKSY